MQFVAKSRYIHYSPFKLRPLADVVRGKNVKYALDWLETVSLKKAAPIRKMIQSAAANAKSLQNIDVLNLVVKEIRVDQGPSRSYFQPRAMGRANVYKRRFSHMNVVLALVSTKEV